MTVKGIWTDEDFDEMNWHDSPIHSISFPFDDLRLRLDIDYMFEWKLNPASNTYNFWISPCELIFLHVLNLKVDFDFGNNVGLTIESIVQSGKRESKNKLATLYSYLIVTDNGSLSFESTGYAMKVRAQPIFSGSQILPRN